MLYCCLLNSGLLSVILFNCFYSHPDLSALLKRVETLETQSRPDISTHMRQLSSYGLRSEADFDKYHAVTLAEAAAVEAHRAADPKAYFLDAACQTLRSSLSRPTDRFKAYFLALFSDKDYTKILDSIAKVDKAFDRHTQGGSTQNVTRPIPSRLARAASIICFNCGQPGHIAPHCWQLRRDQRAPPRRFGRFAPYDRFPQRPRASQQPPNTT